MAATGRGCVRTLKSQQCSAAIWMRRRIASPEMFPEAQMLPHLICSRPIFIGGANDEADRAVRGLRRWQPLRSLSPHRKAGPVMEPAKLQGDYMTAARLPSRLCRSGRALHHNSLDQTTAAGICEPPWRQSTTWVRRMGAIPSSHLGYGLDLTLASLTPHERPGIGCGGSNLHHGPPERGISWR
jgi:hypothetical protein